MLRGVVIGVAMACLMGGAAYAVDEEPADNACSDQVAATDEAVQSKVDSMSEADAEKVNQLLDQADALCTEGKFQDASATLATINGMIAKK
jgi:hypothetical protein